MHNFLKGSSLLLIIVICVSSAVGMATFQYFDNSDEVITHNIDDVVGNEIQGSTDPLRDGTELIGKGVGDADNNDKIYYQEITTTQEAWTKTTDFIKSIINYALGVIGLVALAYLLYHGFLTATAGGNEEQEKKGREGVRYGTMAILGIAVARFVLSLIFRLLQKIT